MSTLAEDFPTIMVHAVEWQHVIGRNEFDEPVLGAKVDLPARIFHRIRQIRGARGEETVARGQALVSGVPEILPDDHIVLRCPTLPVFDGHSPVILDVAPVLSFTGEPYMTKIIF